jgi:hypothetical protein
MSEADGLTLKECFDRSKILEYVTLKGKTLNNTRSLPVKTNNMKTILTSLLAGAFAIASLSCQTTYDAYGNPRQTVDPGTAAAGAAAVGVLGYALAKDRDDDDRRHYRKHHRRHYDRGYYDRYSRYRRY